MPFVCPRCLRPLTRQNSWHFCQRKEIAELFQSKPPALQALFEKLHRELATWPGVAASATKNCAVFVDNKTFLVVRVMKNALDLRFTLPQQTDAFPVYKHQAYGKKLEHYIRLHDEDDLDADVFRLLRDAYQHQHE